jgi:hypothetical protein
LTTLSCGYSVNLMNIFKNIQIFWNQLIQWFISKLKLLYFPTSSTIV